MEDTSKIKKSKIAIVIPTLNEEKGIARVIDQVKEVMKSYNFEIVISDGRSKDRTVEIAKEHGARVIYQRKKGYGDALLAGYWYAIEKLQCEILVNLDADETYDTNDIPKMVDMILSEEVDYVVGKRIVNSSNMKISHILGNKVISWLIKKLLHVNVSDTQCGLFSFRSYLIKNTESWITKGWALNTELLTRAAESEMTIKEIETSYNPRVGTTHNATIKAGATNLAVIIRMILDFQPLLLLGVIGSILLGLGIILGGIVVYDFSVTGKMTMTNTATLAALLVITGIQMISLGLVADMIKRKTKKRIPPNSTYYFEE